MTFTSEHFIALLPILVLAATSIVVMLLTPFTRGNRTVTAAALLGLAATVLALPVAARVAPLFVTPLLLIDGAALMYIGLLVACTLAVAGLGAGYLGGRRDAAGEFHVLLLTAALGGALLAASAHFASLFLGVELLSVSLFGLLAPP